MHVAYGIERLIMQLLAGGKCFFIMTPRETGVFERHIDATRQLGRYYKSCTQLMKMRLDIESHYECTASRRAPKNCYCF
jgi:hypothetical protein